MRVRKWGRDFIFEAKIWAPLLLKRQSPKSNFSILEHDSNDSTNPLYMNLKAKSIFNYSQINRYSESIPDSSFCNCIVVDI